MSEDPRQQVPQGPDQVEIEGSGLPDAIAHKFGPELSRLLARNPEGPYEVSVLFELERPSDEELEALGLFAAPGADLAAGTISRDDLLRLAEEPSVVEVLSWGLSTPR